MAGKTASILALVGIAGGALLLMKGKKKSSTSSKLSNDNQMGVGTLFDEGITPSGIRYHIYGTSQGFFYEITHSALWKPEKRVGVFPSVEAAKSQMAFEE